MDIDRVRELAVEGDEESQGKLLALSAQFMKNGDERGITCFFVLVA
jgi:hypothetical protein